jgi:hypothetical protein
MIRRAIGTTLVGLCALTGPFASSALADAGDPSITPSVSTARAGVPFTVSSDTDCPTAYGAQTVEFSFTDSGGTSVPAGSLTTGDDGSWTAASVQIPVAGLDGTGAWSDPDLSLGAGTLDAVCIAPDTSSDGLTADTSADTSAGASTEADDPGDDGDDPGDDSDGTDPTDDGSDDVITQSYASAALTLGQAAAQLTASAGLVQPGAAVSVTPAEACSGTGVFDVDLSITAINQAGDDSDDPTGSDDSDTEPGADPIVTSSVTTSAGGSWTPVSLVVPKNAATGDYAVSATCSQNDAVVSSYDARPLAVGTVVLNPVVCTARGGTARVSGTYSGTVTGPGDSELTLPSTLKLTGDGPWKVSLQSATTDQVLVTRSLACAQPKYDLTVPKTGVSDAGKVRAWVCNSGRATAVAVLQVAKGKRFVQADRDSLDQGDCAWLTGPRLDRGDSIKAQVLIDPPGKGSTDTDVAATFTAKRGKR